MQNAIDFDIYMYMDWWIRNINEKFLANQISLSVVSVISEDYYTEDTDDSSPRDSSYFLIDTSGPRT